MSTSETLPPSIRLMHIDRLNRYADPNLDFAYIDQTAAFVAANLWDDVSVEVAFQPGDGTRYNLIFVAPTALATAAPRRDWERHAIHGIPRDDAHRDAPAADYYAAHSALVVWVEQANWPVNFDTDLTSDYIAQKFNTTIVSGCTLAILLRAIAHYLQEKS